MITHVYSIKQKIVFHIIIFKVIQEITIDYILHVICQYKYVMKNVETFLKDFSTEETPSTLCTKSNE